VVFRRKGIFGAEQDVGRFVWRVKIVEVEKEEEFLWAQITVALAAVVTTLVADYSGDPIRP
jgi:hypothetical protein